MGTCSPSWTGNSTESIDTCLFNHVYSAFVSPKNITHEFVLADDTVTSLSDFTSVLRQKNTAVKMEVRFRRAGPRLGLPEELDNLALLLVEWRFEIEKVARTTNQPRLLLTAATYFSVDLSLDQVSRSYPVAAFTTSLDWVNATCYDYQGH